MNTARFRKEMISMKFILRSRNLIYNISQYKYVKYQQIFNSLQNMDINEIKNGKQNILNDTKITPNLHIFFIDNRSKETIKNIKESAAAGNLLEVYCTFRCIRFILKELPDIQYKQITIKQIYALNIIDINCEIYKSMNLSNLKSIQVTVLYIDNNRSDIYHNISQADYLSKWNNLNNSLIAGRFVLYGISLFFSKYFLLEIGKNKQAREKIQNKIKELSVKLSGYEMIIKNKNTKNE